LSHPGPVWRRGEVGDHPNPGDKEKFTELLSLLDNLELMSNIVTPSRPGRKKGTLATAR
jgi:hypothetical protein